MRTREDGRKGKEARKGDWLVCLKPPAAICDFDEWGPPPLERLPLQMNSRAFLTTGGVVHCALADGEALHMKDGGAALIIIGLIAASGEERKPNFGEPILHEIRLGTLGFSKSGFQVWVSETYTFQLLLLLPLVVRSHAF